MIRQRLSPLTPIFDPPKRRGAIVTGNTPPGSLTPSATYILRQALLDLSPYSMWDINLLEAPDLGSFGNGGYMVVVPTVFSTGPDNVSHPRLGDVASRLWTTDNVGYGDVYASGMTFVHMFKGTINTSGGVTMAKEKPSGELDRESRLIGNNNLFGVSWRLSNLVARSRESSGDPVVPEAWNMLEVYFPPGDATPSIYVNGVAPTSFADAPGVVGDNGNGYISVGGHNVTGGTFCEGFYAFPAVYMRALTAGERSGLVTAANSEGWF